MSSSRAALDEWCARVDELLAPANDGRNPVNDDSRPVVPLQHAPKRSWSANGVFSDRAA